MLLRSGRLRCRLWLVNWLGLSFLAQCLFVHTESFGTFLFDLDWHFACRGLKLRSLGKQVICDFLDQLLEKLGAKFKFERCKVVSPFDLRKHLFIDDFNRSFF